MTDHRASERCYVRDRTARRICFVFADNAESLLTAVTPADSNTGPEMSPAVIHGRFDNLGARQTRAPISGLAQDRCRGTLITLDHGRFERRFELMQSGLYCQSSRFRYEIRMR